VLPTLDGVANAPQREKRCDYENNHAEYRVGTGVTEPFRRKRNVATPQSKCHQSDIHDAPNLFHISFIIRVRQAAFTLFFHSRTRLGRCEPVLSSQLSKSQVPVSGDLGNLHWDERTSEIGV
jgi:hypothetical protein